MILIISIFLKHYPFCIILSHPFAYKCTYNFLMVFMSSTVSIVMSVLFFLILFNHGFSLFRLIGILGDSIFLKIKLHNPLYFVFS